MSTGEPDRGPHALEQAISRALGRPWTHGEPRPTFERLTHTGFCVECDAKGRERRRRLCWVRRRRPRRPAPRVSRRRLTEAGPTCARPAPRSAGQRMNGPPAPGSSSRRAASKSGGIAAPAERRKSGLDPRTDPPSAGVPAATSPTAGPTGRSGRIGSTNESRGRSHFSRTGCHAFSHRLSRFLAPVVALCPVPGCHGSTVRG